MKLLLKSFSVFMAQAYPSSSPCFSLLRTSSTKSLHQPCSHLQLPQFSSSSSRISLGFTSSFKNGSPLLLKTASMERKSRTSVKSLSIRSEQSTKGGGGLDVWLGRLAMVGFATALVVEVSTGKGLLENFGFVAPIPTLALVVTALVGVLTAIFIFQSASQN